MGWLGWGGGVGWGVLSPNTREKGFRAWSFLIGQNLFYVTLDVTFVIWSNIFHLGFLTWRVWHVASGVFYTNQVRFNPRKIKDQSEHAGTKTFSVLVQSNPLLGTYTRHGVFQQAAFLFSILSHAQGILTT